MAGRKSITTAAIAGVLVLIASIPAPTAAEETEPITTTIRIGDLAAVQEQPIVIRETAVIDIWDVEEPRVYDLETAWSIEDSEYQFSSKQVVFEAAAYDVGADPEAISNWILLDESSEAVEYAVPVGGQYSESGVLVLRVPVEEDKSIRVVQMVKSWNGVDEDNSGDPVWESEEIHTKLIVPKNKVDLGAISTLGIIGAALECTPTVSLASPWMPGSPTAKSVDSDDSLLVLYEAPAELCSDPTACSSFDSLEASLNEIQMNLPYYPGTITPCELLAATQSAIADALSSPLSGLDAGWRISEQLRFVVENCLGFPVAAMQGNGGSWFKIYARPGSITNYYISWSLQTNNINNGADGWGFGVEVSDKPITAAMLFAQGSGSLTDIARSAVLFQENQFGVCQHIGWLSGTLESAYYYVDAGAYGWSTSSECSVTLSWQVKVGVKATITGPETHAEVTMGGAVTCGDGTVYDSESLMKGGGPISYIPDILP